MQLHLLPALANTGRTGVIPNDSCNNGRGTAAAAASSAGGGAAAAKRTAGYRTGAAPARIINVGSVVHRCCNSLDFEWLASTPAADGVNGSGGSAGRTACRPRASSTIGGGGGSQASSAYSAHAAYAQSKLAVAMVSAALARRLADARAPVEVATVHPGIVDTHLYRHVNCLLLAVQKVSHSHSQSQLHSHSGSHSCTVTATATQCNTSSANLTILPLHYFRISYFWNLPFLLPRFGLS